MTPHLDIPVSEQTQVGEARRAASRLATDHELDETAVGEGTCVTVTRWK